MKITGNRKSRGLMFALFVISATGILPWRIVAQDKPEDAAKRFEQLEKDNASLRQEIENLKNSAKRDQRLQLRMDILDDRLQRDMAIASLNVASNKLKRTQVLINDKVESPEMLDIARAQLTKLQAEIAARNESIREREAALAELGVNPATATNDPLAADISTAEAQLDGLRNRYAAQHPAVIDAQKRLQKLKELQVSLKEKGASSDNRKAQERELYLEELKLATKYGDSVRKQMEAGRGTLEELVRAQRQVFDIQREIAKLNADSAQLKQIVQEEMKAVQRLLNEAKKRVEIGTASPGHDLDLQREMLKLKRELLQIEEQ